MALYEVWRAVDGGDRAPGQTLRVPGGIYDLRGAVSCQAEDHISTTSRTEVARRARGLTFGGVTNPVQTHRPEGVKGSGRTVGRNMNGVRPGWADGAHNVRTSTEGPGSVKEVADRREIEKDAPGGCQANGGSDA